MILILMTSRSGSSLVAKIFAAHGFDIGSEQTYSCGYATYENARVKEWIAQHKHLLPLKTGLPCDYVPGVEKCIPPNGVVKIGMEYAGLFVKMSPKVITVKRDVWSVASSLAAKRGNPDKAQNCVSVVVARFAGMDRMRKKWNGAEINTDQIIAGDFSGVRAAFEHHGIDFDEDKARACVEPDKWHKW